MILHSFMRKIERFVSMPLLAAMVITFVAVIADPEIGFLTAGRDISMQSEATDASSPVTANSLSSENIMKLSWVSFGFAGQTIKSSVSEEYTRTPVRVGYDKACFTGSSGNVFVKRSNASMNSDISAGSQTFVLCIARFKAG